MEYDKLVRLFDRAVAANWLDKCRTGNLIELPPDGDVLFTGDIHGSMKNFRAIVRLAALADNPKRHLILQEVTHQLEMGEDLSYQVLEKTAALKVKYPHRVHVLMGNHELAEIQGREIFKGGLCLNLLFDSAIEKAYGERKESVRTMYIDFLKTMPLVAMTQTGIFMSHSTPDKSEVRLFHPELFRRAPEPTDFDKGGMAEKLVWGRDYAHATSESLAQGSGGRVFLVGHAPCTRGFEVPNDRHIILDCKDRYAATLLFDLDKAETHEELKEKVSYLHGYSASKPEKKVESGKAAESS